MNFLEKIAKEKLKETEQKKLITPVSILEKSSLFTQKTCSFKKALCNDGASGVIAEFKRWSPSKGIINANALAVKVCADYVNAGASAVSVLTDPGYFGGSLNDLINVREQVNCPILRKDFIVDEYQIIEAKSIGADAVLLIAEMLSAKKLDKFTRFARSLDLEVLFEIHDENNISKLPYDAEIIGINSRDLNSFHVNTKHPAQLISFLPGDTVKVAESGIRSPENCFELLKAGFDAFLIGELFMSSANPGLECKMFMDDFLKLKLSAIKDSYIND